MQQFYHRGVLMSEIVRDMTEITRCGVQYRTDKLAPFGLKACHASYLAEICSTPGISQDQLARRICINKSNVARQVATLEEDGIVQRVPGTEDKRVINLYPTEKTLQLLPQIQQLVDAWENCITGDLSAEEKVLLESLLIRVRDRASAWMEETQ